MSDPPIIRPIRPVIDIPDDQVTYHPRLPHLAVAQRTFSLDSFVMRAPRSPNGDNLFATISLTIAGDPVVTSLRFIGRRNMGTYPIGLSQSIWARDTDVIVWVYTMISAEHMGQQHAEQAIRDTVSYLANTASEVVAQIGWWDPQTQGYPWITALAMALAVDTHTFSNIGVGGALGKWLTDKIVGLTGCDGPVAAYVYTVPAFATPWNAGSYDHQGPSPPAGCRATGVSDYYVTSSWH